VLVCAEGMSQTARHFIKEPGADNAAHYARRVRRLAAAYVALFGLSLAGLAVLVWRAQLYVTLAQRSNVETLTLAFLMVFFAYLATLSAPGAWGVVHIIRHQLGGNWADHQQRKMRGLGRGLDDATVVDLNVVLEQTDRPGNPFDLIVADQAGRMGNLRVDGARLAYRSEYRAGSNEILAYVERQVTRLLAGRGEHQEVNIVAWKKIDDEDAERYHGMVEFARNLERQLGKGDLWPKVRLSAEECRQLESALADICPALRDEGFLPHWDYQAEHKLPLIPEPLGLITLSRSEQRVDPVSSMGCAVVVVTAVLGILVLFIFAPPWVPGT
jgi:hypothetical protein